MKITDVRTVLLTGPSTSDPYLSKSRKRRSAAFIEIHTDTELIGLGETYGGYFCPEVVPGIVEFFRPILIGQNVDNIPELWRRMHLCGNFWCRVGLGVIVINGIEAALWDLRGKELGVPVYTLLGGCKHTSLPCYATGGPANYPIEQLAAKVEFYVSCGYPNVKVGVGKFYEDSGYDIRLSPVEAAEVELQKLDFLRDRFGPELGVMLDGHMGNRDCGHWELPTALAVVKALESHNLVFFEEPLPYSDPFAYAELSRSTTVAIAGGECLTDRSEWMTYIRTDSFDIGQPDASFTGGLSLFVDIANELGKRGKAVATHAWGAGASLMQNIHCGFACANTRILEMPPAAGPLHTEVVGDSVCLKNGRIYPPEAPGLGIRLTEETKQKFPFKPGSGEFNSVPGKVLPEREKIFGRKK